MSDLLKDPVVVQGMMHSFLNEAAGVKTKKTQKKLDESRKMSSAEIKRLIELNKGGKTGGPVISLDGKEVPKSVLASNVTSSGFTFITKQTSTLWIRDLNIISNEIEEVFIDADDLKKALSKL